MRDHLGGKTVWRRRLFLSGGCNGDNLRDNNNNDHNISLHLLASRDIQSNTSTYNATSISDATSQMQLPSQMAFLDLTCLESWQVGGCSGTPPVGCLPGCKSLSLSKMMIPMANLAVLLFKLSQDSLLKTEYGLSPLHSCELPLHNPSWEAFAKSCTDFDLTDDDNNAMNFCDDDVGRCQVP